MAQAFPTHQRSPADTMAPTPVLGYDLKAQRPSLGINSPSNFGTRPLNCENPPRFGTEKKTSLQKKSQRYRCP